MRQEKVFTMLVLHPMYRLFKNQEEGTPVLNDVTVEFTKPPQNIRIVEVW